MPHCRRIHEEGDFLAYHSSAKYGKQAVSFPQLSRTIQRLHGINCNAQSIIDGTAAFDVLGRRHNKQFGAD